MNGQLCGIFLICNAFISGMICILFTAKKAFRSKLSSRMQYHLGFVLFALLALPFIPVRIFNISSWLNALKGTHPDYTNPAINGETSPCLLDTSRQIDDFAISISHKTPSIIGYILCLLWFAGILMMIFLAARSLFRLHRIIKSSLPLQNNEVRNLYYECLREAGINRKIPLYSTAFLKCPVIVGLLKPRIFLPIHTISDYDPASMRFMLLHELQHFKHKDMAANYPINIAGILYWFNPFVWYALRESNVSVKLPVTPRFCKCCKKRSTNITAIPLSILLKKFPEKIYREKVSLFLHSHLLLVLVEI